jgi:NADH:ubiquinone oxidoreductase subunit 4 (subunit M)
LKQKRFKEIISVFFLAHVGLIAAGMYTLTLDGLRGAVLQMIAHDLWLLDCFMPLKLSSEDTKPEPLLKWAVFVRNHQNSLRCFDFGISICCIANF